MLTFDTSLSEMRRPRRINRTYVCGCLCVYLVSLEPYDIYLAGRFDMVGSIRQLFIREVVEQGALVEHMYADAFAFI